VHQSLFVCIGEDFQGIFFGYRPNFIPAFKSVGPGREQQTIFHRVFTSLTDEALLYAAGTGNHPKRFRLLDII
jgi:hypothetical protein